MVTSSQAITYATANSGFRFFPVNYLLPKTLKLFGFSLFFGGGVFFILYCFDWLL
jgi:hypothetical protein